MNPAEKLLTVTPADDDDRKVATLIADKMLFYAKNTDVYRYQINHDIRPPKCVPCPVEYGWSVKDKVGFEIRNKIIAHRWLTAALLYGYKVEEVDGHRKPTSMRTESIDLVLKRAEFHQRSQLEDDDDIPF